MSASNVMSRRSFAALLTGGAVGYSTRFFSGVAYAASLTRRWRGAVVPTNLAARKAAQNAVAQSVLSALKRDTGYSAVFSMGNEATLNEIVSVPQSLDWRDKNRVTPIKDQGACGSCWIFASTAAFESAYLIANNKDAIDADGYPTIDISEQEALDCSYGDSNCVLGGWHEAVLLYLVLYGEVGGYKYPYNALKISCIDNLGDRPYKLITWGYVPDGPDARNLLPSDDQIKSAILKYGPIVSSVVTTKEWERYCKKLLDGSANTAWGSFHNGIFPGTPTQQCDVRDINHEICVIGWDDHEGVWLIKNSWGTGWGDEGFMKLAYGTNYLGYGSSWLLAQPAASPSPATEERIRDYNKRNSLLRFYPTLKMKS